MHHFHSDICLLDYPEYLEAFQSCPLPIFSNKILDVVFSIPINIVLSTKVCMQNLAIIYFQHNLIHSPDNCIFIVADRFLA